jgi:hypothetical protein
MSTYLCPLPVDLRLSTDGCRMKIWRCRQPTTNTTTDNHQPHRQQTTTMLDHGLGFRDGFWPVCRSPHNQTVSFPLTVQGMQPSTEIWNLDPLLIHHKTRAGETRILVIKKRKIKNWDEPAWWHLPLTSWSISIEWMSIFGLSSTFLNSQRIDQLLCVVMILNAVTGTNTVTWT